MPARKSVDYCALLGTVVTIMAFGLQSIEVAVGQGDQESCGSCHIEYIGPEEILGTGECEHGPGNDKVDCDDPNLVCCEFLPGGCTANAGAPGNGECSCFTCYPDKGCERYVQKLQVYCTLSSGAGVCNPDLDVDPNFEMDSQRVKNVIQSNWEQCNMVSGYPNVESITPCGRTPIWAGCRAQPGACTPDGDWIYSEPIDKTTCRTGG